MRLNAPSMPSAACLAFGFTLTSLAQTPSHPLMHPTTVDIRLHVDQRAAGAYAKIDRTIEAKLAVGVAPVSVNLMSYLPIAASAWNQGACGNCWVWGSTACASILHGEAGVPGPLSVQYFDSNYSNGNGACCGGWASVFASYYNSTLKRFISSNNYNAAFADRSIVCGNGSGISASNINAHPYYSINSMSVAQVQTTGISQSVAIANIKNLLNQGEPITMTFFLSASGWNDFDTWWGTGIEKSIWNGGNNSANQQETSGHLVALVGYDDTDGSWLCLNSWGTTSNRPNGIFRIPQALGYSNAILSGSYSFSQYEFDAFTINWAADTAPPTLSALRTGSVAKNAMGEYVFQIQVSAVGHTVVDRVEFLLDNGYVGTGTAAGATYSISIPGNASGPSVKIPVTAVAYDPSENSSTTTAILTFPYGGPVY